CRPGPAAGRRPAAAASTPAREPRGAGAAPVPVFPGVICILSNIVRWQMLYAGKYFRQAERAVLSFVSLINGFLPCIPTSRGVAFYRSLPDRYVPMGS